MTHHTNTYTDVFSHIEHLGSSIDHSQKSLSAVGISSLTVQVPSGLHNHSLAYAI